MIADWVIEWLSDVEWFIKTNNFPSDWGKREKLSKEFKTITRWPKALINSLFAASIFVICVCYVPINVNPVGGGSAGKGWGIDKF